SGKTALAAGLLPARTNLLGVSFGRTYWDWSFPCVQLSQSRLPSPQCWLLLGWFPSGRSRHTRSSPVVVVHAPWPSVAGRRPPPAVPSALSAPRVGIFAPSRRPLDYL